MTHHVKNTSSLPLFLTLLLALSAGVDSAPAPAPAFDCVQTLLSLSNCLSYVMNGSNTTDPDRSCCVGLQNLQAQDQQAGTHNGVACLCGALNNQPGLGVRLNVSKVLSLADACSIPGVPPVANCTSSAGFPSDLPPPPAPPPEALNHAGIRAFGCADSSSSSLVALAVVAVAFFIY